MSRAGVPSEHAERCLRHLQPGIQQTYDRHRYIAEMAVAYEKLSTLISQIVDPPSGDVIPMVTYLSPVT